MKTKIRNILKKILIIYLIYMFITGILIFKIPYVKASDVTHDISELKSSSENDTYALVVEDTFDALAMRIAMIDAATQTIDISYYSISSGIAADIFYGALLSKANEGVKIRIIVDGITSFGHLKKDFKAVAAHPNIDYALYDDFNPLLFYSVHNSLHDKLLIVDEKYGLIGGRNITDRFLIDDYPKQQTLDRDVLLISEIGEDNVIKQMAQYYDDLFNQKFNRLIQPKMNGKLTQEVNRLIDSFIDYCNSFQNFETYFSNELQMKIKVDNALFVSNTLNRYHKDPIILKTINDLAKDYDEMFIQSPYITNSRMLKKYTSFLDTTDITILTNNITTNPNTMAASGYIRARKQLARKNALFEFQNDNSIHAKTFMLGDDISIIGSMNLDHRSSFLSTESMVFIYSKEFYTALELEIDKLLSSSLKVNPDGTYIDNNKVTMTKKSTYKEIKTRFVSFFTFFIDEML